jgi:hypothetical protein
MDRSPGFEFHFASFSRHARRARNCLAIETDGSELARFCPAFSSAAQFNLKGRSGWFGSPTLYAGRVPHATKAYSREGAARAAGLNGLFGGTTDAAPKREMSSRRTAFIIS